MKAIKVSVLLIATFTGLLFNSAAAQELKFKIPAASPAQRIEQDFGLGTISVKYYRPNTKGRKVFGGLEPYGTVWRTGANNATVVSLTDTVWVEGHAIAPGSYSLFSIPGANEWTIIFNKEVQQWGAYAYNEKQDLLRFKVKPTKLPNKIETLTIQFANVNEEDCVMQIQWENTAIDLHLKTNVIKRIVANIADAMKGENKPYYMSAIWYYNHGLDNSQALAWIQEQNKAQPQAFNVKYWLAKIQLKAGDKKAAIAAANEGLKLALAQNNQEYVRMNKEVLTAAGAN
jgi:hypothetical protein